MTDPKPAPVDLDALERSAIACLKLGPDGTMAGWLAVCVALITELRSARSELVDREHLEEGARLMLASHELGLVRDTAYGAALDRWLKSERIRKAKVTT